MNQLIPVEQRLIGSTAIQTVNARELYEFLAVKADFSDWIKRRISAYSFLEGIDFTKFLTSMAGTISPIEYHLSLDMAKQLAMVERTAKGKEARLYFLECERQAIAVQNPAVINASTQAVLQAGVQLKAFLEIGQLLGTPVHFAQQEAVKAIRANVGIDLGSMLLGSPAQDVIPETDVMLEPTNLAPHFGLSTGVAMNQRLAAMHLQVKVDGEWVPTPEGTAFCARHAWTVREKSGYNLKWSLVGVRTYAAQA